MTMIKPIKKYGHVIIFLLLVFLVQACGFARSNVPAVLPTPTARDIEPTATKRPVSITSTPTVTVEFSGPTQTEILPTMADQSKVKISAVKGNLFIRRGPDMAFNPIGVLYKDTSAEVIAHDILSKWAQIKIPDSKATGWVSLQTKYSKLDGDLSTLPELSVTEWPKPAYLRNCTYHRMYILPSQIYLNSYLGSPENEVWLYPGDYTVYDIDVPGDPVEVLQVTISEGSDKEILLDGLGERRKCP
jgi:hypothetical protein